MDNFREIRFSDTKDIGVQALQSLFASVNWDSANYPDKLVIAMRNSDKVLTAWHGETLVGLMNALSDGVVTACFHYLLVRPECHGIRIGTALLRSMLDHYEAYARKVLIAYDEETGFYQHCGFERGAGKTPMFVTYLKT